MNSSASATTFGRRHGISIATRVLIGFLILSVPVAVILTATSWHISSQATRERVIEALDYQAEIASQRLESDLTNLLAELSGVVKNPLVANALADGTSDVHRFLGPYLSGLHLSINGISGMSLLDYRGRTVWPPNEHLLTPDIRQQVPRIIDQGKPLTVLDHDGFVLLIPIRYGPTGSYEGVLAADIPGNSLLNDVSPNTTSATSVTSGGRLVARRGTTEGVRLTVDRKLKLPAPLDQLNLHMTVSRPENEVLAPLYALHWLHIGVGTGMIVMTSLGAWVVSRRITSRIIKLDRIATTVATSGNAGVVIPDLGDDELGRLAGALRVMLDQLSRHRQDLEAEVAARTAQLTEARSRLDSILDSMQDVVWSTTPDAKTVLYISQASSQVFGLDSDDLITDPTQLLQQIEESDRAAVIAACRRLVGGESISVDFTYVRRPDQPIRVQCRAHPIRAADGRIVRLDGTFSDISAAAKAEAALRQATAIAENAVAAKSIFLANMSHEIRTPMNGVLGLTELLLSSDLDPQQREQAATIYRSGTALLTILNDILDFSKIEAGRLDLECVPFSLPTVLDDVMQLFLPRAREAGITLSLSVPDDLPAYRMGDPARVRQILVNLVGNAVKFTNQGSVTISLAALAEDRLSIRIADSGIGIAADRIEALFNPFIQGDASTARRYGGTGLGLVITRRLAELMHGSVQVSSILGSGSTFTVELRLPPAAQQQPPETERYVAPAVTKTVHVLLAEDNAINRTVAVGLLSKMGIKVTTVENGRLAVAAMAEGGFDLILMDCQMPELDGFGATTAIRDHEAALGLRRIPIIAMTANAMRGDREACIAAGMDDYLAKPVTGAALRETLERWM